MEVSGKPTANQIGNDDCSVEGALVSESKRRGQKPGCVKPVGSGRKKGTPNKVNSATREDILRRIDPVGWMARAIQSPKTPIEIKLQIALASLRRLLPELRSVELGGIPGGDPIQSEIVDRGDSFEFTKRLAFVLARTAMSSTSPLSKNRLSAEVANTAQDDDSAAEESFETRSPELQREPEAALPGPEWSVAELESGRCWLERDGRNISIFGSRAEAVAYAQKIAALETNVPEEGYAEEQGGRTETTPEVKHRGRRRK